MVENKTSRKNHTLSYIQRRQLEDFIRMQKNLLGDKAWIPDIAEPSEQRVSVCCHPKECLLPRSRYVHRPPEDEQRTPKKAMSSVERYSQSSISLWSQTVRANSFLISQRINHCD